jgi:hypothetical protein
VLMSRRREPSSRTQRPLTFQRLPACRCTPDKPRTCAGLDRCRCRSGRSANRAGNTDHPGLRCVAVSRQSAVHRHHNPRTGRSWNNPDPSCRRTGIYPHHTHTAGKCAGLQGRPECTHRQSSRRESLLVRSALSVLRFASVGRSSATPQ